MNSNEQIPEYVTAFLNRKADEHQKKMFAEWLAIDQNKTIFAEIDKINNLAGDLKSFEKFNLVEGKISVLKKIRNSYIIRFTSIIQKVAAILFIPILVISAWYYIQNNQLKKDIDGMQVVQEIKSQSGIKSHFFLPDGTEVWLNATSSIRFPSIFKEKTRTIQLNGEAFFKVFKDKNKPFVVKTDVMDVVALGTAFNLCAYSEDNQYSTTLEEGKVQVINTVKKGENFILEPGEQINFERDKQQFIKSKVEVNNFIAWKDGKLIFNETPFHEVVKRLGRWFNTDIQLADKSIADYRYTATFTNENLDQVLELLKLTAPISYSSVIPEKLNDTGFSKKQIIIRKNANAKIEVKTKK